MTFKTTKKTRRVFEELICLSFKKPLFKLRNHLVDWLVVRHHKRSRKRDWPTILGQVWQSMHGMKHLVCIQFRSVQIQFETNLDLI